MRHRVMLFALAATSVLAGCNQPAVSLKPPAFQSSENTVRDWNDVAGKIAATMSSNGLLPAPAQPGVPVPPPPRPVFVRVQAPDSTFLRQVADELEAQVLRTGGRIARSADDATVVNLDVDVVSWGPRDKPPGLLGSTAGILAIPGIVAGASAPFSTWAAADAAIPAAAGVGILADGLVALTPTMNAEAVWSATIATADRVVMKLREPVYIRAPDIPLYATAATVSPILSWGSVTPLPIHTYRYGP